VIAPLALCRARAGATDEARKLQKELETVAASRYIPAQALAEIHLGFGENDRALEYLEKGCDERSALLLWLLGDEIYDPVRSHPRFAALVKRMALD
jgi:hypothetical protein